MIRVTIVLAVVIGVVADVLSAVWTGPPRISDPLTGQDVLRVGAGNFTFLSGLITGEDYIVGNYTVVNPVGALVEFDVFNSTGFLAFARGGNATTVWSTAAVTSGRIVFAAPYTDTFYLVFVNPYLPTTHLGIGVYVSTNYESNVVLG